MAFFETGDVELKEKFNDKFVKETVAFLNTSGGKIIIGVNDKGEAVGVDNIDETLRRIADVISDQIEPSAADMVDTKIITENGKLLISVSVDKGIKPLYCIKKYGYSSSGCLLRVGTACRSMTEEQIATRYRQRFILNDLIVEAPTNLPALSFRSLKQYYVDKGYRLNEDSFETNLYLVTSDGRYNLMGELLSDNNRYSLIFVKFNGKNKAAISQRTDFGKRSLVFAYEQLMNRISSENICVSDTSVRPRKDTYLYDFDSVNEAVINAIVHNDWTISEPQISFYSDRMEIISHGGLPNNLTKEEFFRGISRPRNLKLMKIFSDLDIVEHTGHGIPAITEKYGTGVFDITDNYIMVTIPFNEDVVKAGNVGLNVGINVGLKPVDEKILEAILRNPKVLQNEIAVEIGKSVKTVERHLYALAEKGYIIRQGSKKTGQWKVIK